MHLSLRTAVGVLASATLVACAAEDPLPPRGVEALLLSDGSATDTVPATVMRKHRDLMRSLASRDGRASSYLSMQFRFMESRGTPSVHTASATGPSNKSSVVMREQDYFLTLSAGLPADVLGVTNFRLQEYGDEFATMNGRISPTRSVSVLWNVVAGEWKLKFMHAFDHEARPALPETGTVRVIGRRTAR